ncbi:MAG: DUF2924 domain-containing protein [Akkermansia sp.]|nr:DUF2924 domain-containing protein [Akkermansia sp.]
MKQISEKELEVRVAALAAMSPFELREEWARVWGTRCYSHNYALLRRRIKWRLYTLCHGPLAAAAIKRAETLADFSQLRERAPSDVSPAPALHTKTEVVAKALDETRRWNLAPEGSLIEQMQSHPGSYLKRKYRGTMHVVYCNGPAKFMYGGLMYDSLSAVATRIAGYNISGNKFFTSAKTEVSLS